MSSLLEEKKLASEASEWDNWFRIGATSEDEISSRPATRTSSTSANWALASVVQLLLLSADMPSSGHLLASGGHTAYFWNAALGYLAPIDLQIFLLHCETIAGLIKMYMLFFFFFYIKEKPHQCCDVDKWFIQQEWWKKIVSTFFFYRRQSSTINNSAIIIFFF